MSRRKKGFRSCFDPNAPCEDGRDAGEGHESEVHELLPPVCQARKDPEGGWLCDYCGSGWDSEEHPRCDHNLPQKKGNT